MPTPITLTMPRGPRGPQVVDLDKLTPKARAVAEAIAQTDKRWIRIRSVKPAREVYSNAELFFGADSAELDQPVDDSFEGWSIVGRTSTVSIEDILEYECRKFPCWYPVADDGTDLPSSAAARDDDGLTRDQALRVLHDALPEAGVHITADVWMRHATKGARGFPAPARHNGRVSLWSRAAVEAFAGRLTAVAALRDEIEALQGKRKAAALGLLDDGLPEVLVAAVAGVDRGSSLRKWRGKPRTPTS